MRSARLGDVVASMKNGIYKPASEYSDDGMPCLRMYNIDAGSIVWRDIKRMRIDDREFADYGLHEGDLLVNRVNSRELVGKAAYIPASLEPSVFESKNIRLRLDRTKALPKFINYQLFARGSRHFANNAQQVVGMASISQGQLADFPIVLTDLDEQRGIVAEIEKQFSRLDEAVANLQRVKANLGRYRGAVISDAVSGRMDFDDAPSLNTWQRSSLSSLTAKITSGSRDWSPYYGKGEAIFVLAQNVRPFSPDFSKIQHVDPPANDPARARSRVQRGDLLVTIVGANTGQACMVESLPAEAFVCQSVALIRPAIPEAAPYMNLWMNSPDHGQEYFAQCMYGQGRPHLGFEQLAAASIALPPLADQHRIVAEVDRRLSIVREVEAEVDANLKRAQALRQGVLARAFTGSSNGVDRA